MAEQFSAWAPENANNKAQENILYALEKDTAKLAWIIEGSINSLIAAYVWCAFSRKRGTMKTFAIGLKVARDKASKDGVKLSESDIKKIRNSASREYTIYLYGELVRDEPMLECLFESFLKGVVIVLCMDSRKVFVGRVVFMGEPNESSGMDKEVTIVPFYSGVEEQVSLQVDIKSDLSKVETVTLKQEKLVYAHYYKPGFQNNTGIHEDLPNASEATRGRGKSV
ncbi:hypothetical protein [Marinobacter sp. OP 3.4]|uniref:hypothetical protein n=1 Tax=Marinobacter sp. OP 3.4 TaxID=3076501 RepID=UPI002E24DD69